MAWVRCCGGKASKVLLSALGSLSRSFTRWVKNSYITGVASDGNYNANLGSVSFTGNTALVVQDGGYSCGFVTNCEVGKTYNINFTLTGNYVPRLRVCFYNGTSLSSYIDLETGSRGFTVPSGVTDVVLVPRQNDNGYLTLNISTFTEA